jgi:hypothetical protein
MGLDLGKQRKAHVIFVSQAREALTDYYIGQVTPEMIRQIVVSGNIPDKIPTVEDLSLKQVIASFEELVAPSIDLGTADVLLLIDEINPSRTHIVKTSAKFEGSIPRPYQQIVTKGIALLDEQQPDWRDRINWETLDLGESRFCIIGQLNDGEFSPTAFLNQHDNNNFESDDYGYSLPTGGNEAYAGLTAEWKRQARPK